MKISPVFSVALVLAAVCSALSKVSLPFNSGITVKDAIAKYAPSLSKQVANQSFFDAVNPIDWPIDALDYDENSKTLTVQGSYSSSVEVIPSFLTMSGVRVKVTLVVTAGNILRPDSSLRLSLAGFVVSGTWSVGSTTFDLTVTKDSTGLSLTGAPDPSTVDMDSLLSALGESDFLPAGLDVILSNNAGLNSFSLQQTVFSAFYSKTRGYAVSVAGFPTIAGWGSFKLNLVLRRLNGQKSVVTMTTKFQSFSLSSLVNQLTGIDISGVPVIGSITLPEIGLIISTDDLNPSLIPNSDTLLANAVPFKKGATMVTTFSLVSGTAPSTYLIRLNKGNVKFESSTGDFTITVGQLLQTLISTFDPSTIEMPPGMPDIFGIVISDFAYDADSKSVSAAMSLGGDVNLVPNLIKISDPTLTFDVTLSKPRKIAVTGNAGWQMGSKNLPLTISRAADGTGFIIEARGSQLAVGEVLTQFGAALLPGELEPILMSTGLTTFNIQDPVARAAVRSGLKDIQVFLSGSPTISGWSGVKLNSVISKKGNSKAVMAAGFDFANTNFAQLVRSITGLDVSGISLLDQGMQSAVIISPQSIPGVTLEGAVLSQLSIDRGASISAIMNFPTNCGSDVMCTFCKTALGPNADIRLQATITSAKQFVITAALADINLGGGFTLSPAGLEFQLGADTSVGITAALSIANPKLEFEGAIRAGIQGLELSLTMVGVWKRAFGIKYLAFGNAKVSTNIYPGVPLPGLQVGAEVRVGDLDSGRELIGQCYVGFDPLNPRRNYFYGSVNGASIGAILNAFGMSISLPKVLLDSGFPEGLSTSAAFDTVEPVPGIVVPAGFKLNGTMNIIGYRVLADINLDPPSGVTIKIVMDPINLAGGLFKLYRSKSNRNQGPIFYADVKLLPTPKVVVKASGYASILGMIEQFAELEITNTQYIMSVTGRFFLFDATLKVYASYGSLKSASLRVYGLLSTAWMNSIKDKAVAAIKDSADKATAEIKAAQDKVDGAQRDYDRAVNSLRAAQGKVNSAQRDYDTAVNALRKAQNDVNGLCHIKRCNRVCVGCPGWNGCCKKVWGSCIGCPGWNDCCTRIEDPVCVTANGLCEGTRATAYGALELAKQTVDKNRWPLDAAKATLRGAQEVVDKNRWPLDVAKAALEAAKQTVKVGAAAASAITRLTLGGLINIRKIEFDVEIGVASGGSFSGTMEASFLGKSYVRFSFNLKMKSLVDMALDLADRVFPGISGRRRRDLGDDMVLPVTPIPEVVYDDADRDDSNEKPCNSSPHSGHSYATRDETDDAVRAVEQEKRRHAAEAKKMQRQVRKLKAAANSTDYLPHKSIEFSKSNLHLSKLHAKPETRREACEQAQTMINVLKTFSALIESVVNGWKQSFDHFRSEGVEAVLGLDANLTVNASSGDIAVSAMMESLVEWRRMAYERLLEQNEMGIRVLLVDMLEREVVKLSGMKLKLYLNRVVTALHRPYRILADRRSKAREVIGAADAIAQLVELIFTQTITEAAVHVDSLSRTVDSLGESTRKMCM